MGGLIRTIGTKLLAAHFNEEFSAWIAFYRAPARMALFDTSLATYSSLFDITNNALMQETAGTDPYHIHSRRSDRKCLLPHVDPGDFPHGQKHGNLQGRWLWFLQNALMAANDVAIAAGIHLALNDNTYNSITFDTVETTGTQAAAATTAYDAGTKYMQILLITPAMTTGSPAAGVGPVDT